MGFVWLVISALVVAAGLKARARQREALGESARLDDDQVRSIVETGALPADADEPLDMREIDAEEERFWSETWEEPEEL
jgi:hypothetical protein